MDLSTPKYRLTLRETAVAVPATALLLVAVFVPVPVALRGPTVRALLDLAHFSLAAGACWFLWARLRWAGWVAFLAVVLAAGLCEILQGFTGRCPAVSDFLRGVSGAFAGLICLSAFRASVSPARWIAASIAVIAVSAWPISEFLLATARFCIRVSAGVI